jgi:hypothetical protein
MQIAYTYSPLSFTRHGQARMRQRSIPVMIANWVVTYGERVDQPNGCASYYLSKRGRRELESAVGFQVVASMSRFLNVYVVCDPSGAVITVARSANRTFQRRH